MDNQGNLSMSRRFTDRHGRPLAFLAVPVAMLLALIALLALNGPAFAQSDPLNVVVPSNSLVPVGDFVEGVQGGSVTFQFTVQNNSGVPLSNTNIQHPCNGGLTLLNPNPAPNPLVIPPGAIWTYQCVISGLTQTFPATVGVTAQRPDNTLVTDNDSTDVRVFSTGINVTKVASPNPVIKGGSVTFDIIVRNTGTGKFTARPAAPNPLPAGDDGSFIKVQDLQCNPVPANALDAPVTVAGTTVDNGTAGVLDPEASPDVTPGRIDGDVFVYRCTTTNVLFSFRNQVNVTAKNDIGQTFDRIAFADVTVLSPGLAITKVPQKAIVNVGEAVNWTIKVYNTGQTSFVGFPNPTDTPVTPGDPTCTLSGTVDKGVESGNPAAPNDLNPGEVWTYTCSVPGGYATAGTHQNRADSAPGVTPAASAIGSVQVVQPGLVVVKKPPFQYVLKGQNANFTIDVINTGTGDISNIQVLDPLCSVPPVFTGGDTNNDGKLTPDNPATAVTNEAETWTYACTLLNVQADATNSVTVKGTSASGSALQADATAFVKVINVGLNIAKGGSSAGNPVVPPTAPADTSILVNQGADATFNLLVTNQGNIELSNVAVSDPFCDATAPNALAPVPQAGFPTFNTGDTDRDNKLDPGENWQYICTRSKLSQDIVNTASVTARDPLNNLVSAQTSRQVDVLTPGLVLEKTPPFQSVQAGQPVAWTLRVRNTGQATLFPDAFPQTVPGLGITDFALLCATSNIVQNVAPFTAPGLEPGESWSFVCTLPAGFFAVQGLDNYVNTAVARFVDAGGNKISDFESAQVQIFGNTIDIEKSASTPIVAQGQSVDFTLQVRNLKSTVVLSNLQVTDALCNAPPVLQSGSDTNGDGKLQIGELWTYKCTVNGQTSDYVNTATATAVDSNGNTVTDNDVVAIQVINAKLSVIKTTTTPVVSEGSNVVFTIQVKNTGAIRLVNPKIADNLCQGGNATFVSSDFNNDNALSPGETWTYTCTVPNVQQNFTNTASATATEETTGIVVNGSGQASVTVARTVLTLQKTPKTQNVLVGQSASFVLVVSNPGTTNVTNVNLQDVQCNVGPTRTGGDTNNDNILNPGESWTYSCVVNNVQTNFVNSASVTGVGPNGALATSDTASVTVINPSINLDKAPKQQTVNVGGSANFILSVSNHSNAPLNTIVLSDAQCNVGPTLTGGDTNSNGQLDPNETWTYSCTINNVQANFTNSASVTAKGPNNSSVSATDTASVTVLKAGISLTKTPKQQTVSNGQAANFTILVQNTGNTSLSNVQVTDAPCNGGTTFVGGDTNSNGQLDPSETWVYSCVVNNVQASFINTASVTATGAGQNVNASDTANVTVQPGGSACTGIDVVINPHTATVVKGSTVPFIVTVTPVPAGCNTPLTKVTLKVDKCNVKPGSPTGDVNNNAQLDPTETWTYSCSATNVKSNFTNTASVSAKASNGKTVKDSDKAAIKVTKSSVKASSDDSVDETDTWDLSSDDDADVGDNQLYLPLIEQSTR